MPTHTRLPIPVGRSGAGRACRRRPLSPSLDPPPAGHDPMENQAPAGVSHVDGARGFPFHRARCVSAQRSIYRAPSARSPPAPGEIWPLNRSTASRGRADLPPSKAHRDVGTSGTRPPRLGGGSRELRRADVLRSRFVSLRKPQAGAAPAPPPPSQATALA